MRLAIIYSRANSGIQAPLVTVEVHISNGLPAFNIVGLPKATVKESKERVRSALMNSGFEYPTRRITINLAPADLPKEGARFDLPIALGILVASAQLPSSKINENEFTGELALTGELRDIRGILPMVISAKKAGRNLIIPEVNAHEAALVKEATVFAADHLLAVCAYLKGERELTPCQQFQTESLLPVPLLDISEVKGQEHAKKALAVAVAGKHSLLYLGPPGTGKTMLANRVLSLLPLLTEEEALESAAIASVSSLGFNAAQWQQVPFRSPHHTSSSVALVGGGRPPKPGEISLAHHGVLFLDELPEFNRQVLECLREPLESGQITISRAAYQVVYPARFQLIAAMNPCPCGQAGNEKNHCRCTQEQIQRYMNKLSGPLLDRIDLQVEVPQVSPSILSRYPEENQITSDTMRQHIVAASTIQFKRQHCHNAHLTTELLMEVCHLDRAAESLLMQIMKKFNFSARIYHRILKVARTLADLVGCESVDSAHISEAMTFRCLDKAKLVE